MHTLDLPLDFGPRSIASWLALWIPHAGVPELSIRVRGGTRLDPAGIVLLAAGIAARTESRHTTWMEFEPAAGAVEDRLLALDFFSELGVPSPQPVHERALSASLTPGVPLRRVLDLSTARRLADLTRDLLERAQHDLAPSPVRAAQFVFEELGANIVQHSGRARTGFGLALADRERGRLQVAFADAGMGFWKSLATNPEFTARIGSHGEAIKLALHKRVTRGGRGNMGLGLHLLADLSERLRGEIWIASGDALLWRSFASAAGVEERQTTMAEWSGACVCLEVPLVEG